MPDNEDYILQTINLSKSFGGIKAVNNVSFKVKPKENLGVIGPNGAGKTTMFNLITGYIPIDSGEIIFENNNIEKLPARKRSLTGISRTFQTSQLFLDLTIKENLFLAANKNQNTYNIFIPWNKDKEKIEKSIEIAKEIGLYDNFNVKAKELPHGKRRLLGIGQALISDSKLLMLDEPAAGLPAQERNTISKLIKKITKELTLIIIDHDMDIIFDLADRVLVMNQGEILAIGDPEEIQNNEEVQRIYVGGE
ncbi:ATP-binding cassette domain-containing protein [Halanaerobiaceae bacterium Z-7014]|uniref:ATP-binding cassette domain-containing protein n=1 Tax=Halonatronomonas betaini TaxID=2778430 RepID=A0A931F5N7_9FIRM|nr:ATP-binding cassette domain-containing protein [Halonatronomonas betaini]MBF8436075.1 ATP-binding cassette domain-containing protein [Halonatronomonas betaini]